MEGKSNFLDAKTSHLSERQLNLLNKSTLNLFEVTNPNERRMIDKMDLLLDLDRAAMTINKVVYMKNKAIREKLIRN